MGKIARVDLSQKVASIEDLPEDLVSRFIGGRGLSVYYIFKEVPPEVAPLSEDNKILFFTGPLNGTLTPYASKYVATTLSPLTHTITRTLSGGLWAAELKYAGFDGLIIEGASKNPIYLSVEDGKIRFHDAGPLWGLQTDRAEYLIQEELGGKDWRVLTIGPAGENQVLYACIINDGGRAAGRGGAGAVLGSKRLKAIAVRGHGGVKLADKEGFMVLLRDAYKSIRDDPLSPGRINYGTTGTVSATYSLGILPVMNYSRSILEGVERIMAESIRREVFVHNYACFACSLPCSKISYIREGPWKGTFLHGPQFESIGLLGSNCGITDPHVVARANALCNQLGLDTISTGNAIGFAMECYERGILTSADTEGLDLRFGRKDALLELIQLIAYRKGIGSLFAEGTDIAAKRIGKSSEAFAMTSKGQPFASFDPRSLVGMGLLYATSPFGANHSTGPTLAGETKLGTLKTEGKPELVKGNQDRYCLMDSMILCAFSRYGLNDEMRGEFLELVTGRHFDTSPIAERIFTLERLFNVRKGFDRRNDTLPWRSLSEPMPDGPARGNVVSLNEMLNAYYHLRDWDENGIPTRRSLERLGLGWAEEDLTKRGIKMT